jgi:hypothetical protein
MLIHYLYRDEPSLGRWQSGLTTVRGTPKPALAAAMLPLVQVSRKGSTTVVWGQVRPGSGAQRYVVQVHRGGQWAPLSGARRTNAGGSFTIPVTASRGSVLRLWYPARRLAGPAIVVG